MSVITFQLDETIPRVRLGELPSPLQPLYSLSKRLGIYLWAKRDDLTGFALGGNKVRELEYHLGEALEAGADTIVTTGNSQSNHARTAAAACCKLGLDCHLVLEQGLRPRNGNLLLDRVYGAHIELLSTYTPELAVAAMEAKALVLRSAGRRPHIVPFGGCSTTGAIGFVRGTIELIEQIDANKMRVDYVYLATASCGTQAGTIAGIAATGRDIKVRGISVSDPRSSQELQVRKLANDTLISLDAGETVPQDAVDVDDGYIGEGYGRPTPGTWDAIKLVARSEGLLLDPVYTGKAMAALVDHARTGVIPEGATVVFLHTGGVPGLFAYGDEAESIYRGI